MSFWFYPTNSSAGWPDFDGICGFRNESDADFYVLQLNSTSLEGRIRTSSGTPYSITYTGGFTMNGWNHCVLTYDGSNLKLYLDGSLAGSTSASGSISNGSVPFNIGYIPFPNPPFYFQGDVDEVTLYNDALTSSEVSTLYNSCGPDLNDPNLQLYYPMNDGTAGGNNQGVSVIQDQMGNIDGTISGMTLTGSTSNFVTGVSSTTYDSISLNVCNQYFLQGRGITATTSGVYRDTLVNASGCDSILTLNLEIDTLDATLLLVNDTLVAQAGYSKYQWYNCNSNSIINFQTTHRFKPGGNGSYAVIITEGACVDTSNCIQYSTSGVGLEEESAKPVASVFPNPHHDYFEVQLNDVSSAQIQIINLSGQTVYSKAFARNESIQIQLNQPAGIYLMRVITEETTQVVRIVKD